MNKRPRKPITQSLTIRTPVSGAKAVNADTEGAPVSEPVSDPATGPATGPAIGAAKALVEAFAAQLEEMKSGLGQGEVVLLGFSGLAQSRALRKIDLRVQGDEIISVTVTWQEGDTEKRVFTPQTFQPVLGKNAAEAEPQGGMTEEIRTMMQQMLGHLTAHGVLYTQMLARDAGASGDAKTFLDGEHKRALEVVKSAAISASGMDAVEIRNKALAVVGQTFGSIHITDDKKPRIIN